MPDDLDAIPWAELTHAYGPADDVPALLRVLRTAPADAQGDDSPLYQLFGNIWNQGTVYEATAYAVPFLLDIAADPRTKDRVGVLHLLSAIAQGSSYREAHGDMLGERDFASERRRELQWVKAAHGAVAAGYERLVAMAGEPGDVGLAAAHVLAQLPQHAVAVGHLLRGMLAAERRELPRAGLLLLLGQCGDRSAETLSALAVALDSQSQLIRRAAALSVAHLKPDTLPEAALAAIEDVVASGEDVREDFDGLPWDAVGEVLVEQAVECLDAEARHRVAGRLIDAIEQETASDGHVSMLLDLLFPRDDSGRAPRVTAEGLSPTQVRAVRALAAMVERPKRVFYGHFPQWGLPDTNREWRALAAGRSTAVDPAAPMLADAARPDRPIRPDAIVPGQRIRHRHFGEGTVISASTGTQWTNLTIDFDDEGRKRLMFPPDGSPPR